MDKNLLIRFFEGQATTDEEMKVRKWMEASTENRRTYFKERKMYDMTSVSYTHLTLPTTCRGCRSRWSPYH